MVYELLSVRVSTDVVYIYARMVINVNNGIIRAL